MGLIYYSDYYALFAIAIQFISYANQYILQVILLYPLWQFFDIEITILNILAVTSFYKANKKYKKYEESEETNASYCKQCKRKIVKRDHHCVFIGQCVDGINFRYFLSYTLYSYTLSALLLIRFVMEWKTTLYVLYWGHFQVTLLSIFSIEPCLFMRY